MTWPAVFVEEVREHRTADVGESPYLDGPPRHGRQGGAGPAAPWLTCLPSLARARTARSL